MPKGQGVEINLVKINNNGWKSKCASLGRKLTGGGSASLTDLKKGCTDKQNILNVDRQIDTSTVERNMHDFMTPEKP